MSKKLQTQLNIDGQTMVDCVGLAVRGGVKMIEFQQRDGGILASYQLKRDWSKRGHRTGLLFAVYPEDSIQDWMKPFPPLHAFYFNGICYVVFATETMDREA